MKGSRMEPHHKIYAKELQKQMDADMEELITEEAMRYDRGQQHGINAEPAYMGEDVFAYKKREAQRRAALRRDQHE